MSNPSRACALVLTCLFSAACPSSDDGLPDASPDGGSPGEAVYIKASDGIEFHHFGTRVALSGDTLAVASLGTNQAGDVHIFMRSGDVWMEQAVLHGSNTEAGDTFGDALALSGDTLVVGATGE